MRPGVDSGSHRNQLTTPLTVTCTWPGSGRLTVNVLLGSGCTQPVSATGDNEHPSIESGW